MKSLLMLVFPIIPLSVGEQNAFSLEEYTPTFSYQTGTNCFAYAAAYMALSTQMAYEKNVKNPDASFALSYDFVDNLVAYMKTHEKNFYENAAKELYGMDSADELADLDYTFYVLYKYGGKRFNQYKSEKITEKTIEDPTLLKFSKPKEIFAYGDVFDKNKANTFKKYIREGKPVIICVNQPQASCDRWDIKKKVKSKIKHIVTIIGFQDDTFLIQNNYGGCECRHYYSIAEVNNIMEWAHVYETTLR